MKKNGKWVISVTTVLTAIAIIAVVFLWPPKQNANENENYDTNMAFETAVAGEDIMSDAFSNETFDQSIHDTADSESDASSALKSLDGNQMTPTEISNKRIAQAINDAADFVYDWSIGNKYGNENDTIISDHYLDTNIEYYAIEYPGVRSIDDVRTLAKQHYTSSIIDELLNGEIFDGYVEENGKLYTVSERQYSPWYTDHLEITVEKSSDKMYILHITEYESEDNGNAYPLTASYDAHYMLINGYWVFDKYFNNYGQKIKCVFDSKPKPTSAPQPKTTFYNTPEKSSLESLLEGKWLPENGGDYILFEKGKLYFEYETGHASYSIIGGNILSVSFHSEFDEDGKYEWNEDAIEDRDTWYVDQNTLIFEGERYVRGS